MFFRRLIRIFLFGAVAFAVLHSLPFLFVGFVLFSLAFGIIRLITRVFFPHRYAQWRMRREAMRSRWQASMWELYPWEENRWNGPMPLNASWRVRRVSNAEARSIELM